MTSPHLHDDGLGPYLYSETFADEDEAHTSESFTATGKPGATATPLTLAGGTASGAPTIGAHVKGELVADDVGALWYCRVAGTPGTWVQVGGAPAATNVPLNPAIIAGLVGPQASFTDVDAGMAVTFTAPSSGRVTIVVGAQVTSVANTSLEWNLREGSSDLAGTSATILYNNSVSIVQRSTFRFLVTGLTPGSVHTYKLGQKAGAGASTAWGGTAGQGLMEAWVS